MQWLHERDERVMSHELSNLLKTLHQLQQDQRSTVGKEGGGRRKGWGRKGEEREEEGGWGGRRKGEEEGGRGGRRKGEASRR